MKQYLDELEQLVQYSLRLRTDLRGAMEFGNTQEEKRLTFLLSANNSRVVDAVADFLERIKKVQARRVLTEGDTNVNVTKHTPIDLSSYRPKR